MTEIMVSKIKLSFVNIVRIQFDPQINRYTAAMVYSWCLIYE